MDVLQQLPYSDNVLDLINRCKELIPKSLTKRAVLVGVTAGLVVYLISKKKYKLPPGPRGWPLLGNILEFRNATIYQKLVEWKAQYGPVVAFNVGPATMVGLSSTEAVYEAFVKRQADFAGRPQSYSFQLLTDGGKSIALADYSPTWKLHRKLATKALKHYMTGRQLEVAIEESLTKGIQLMKEEKGPFNPHKYTTFITFNIINSICFSYTRDINDEPFKEMLDIMDAFNTDFGNGVLEDYIPPLRLFPTKKLKWLISLTDRFIGHINRDIYKHRETFSKDNIRDFCDAMLLAQEEATEEEDPVLISQITDGHITQTMGDIFAAGFDTTRQTLLWALLYLALYPKIQNKLHQEIDQALGARKIPRISDRSNLPYTDAVLHEVMRMSSLVPLAIPHTTICDTKLGDYDVPKGTTVIANLYAIHHDPKNWKDPEMFKPERFLDRQGKMAPKPDSWLPFSAGRRVCLGESVAKPELQLLLAGMMRQMKVLLPNRETFNVKTKGDSFSIIPDYFEIVIEARP